MALENDARVCREAAQEGLVLAAAVERCVQELAASGSGTSLVFRLLDQGYVAEDAALQLLSRCRPASAEDLIPGHGDAPFGELALQLGLVTPAQLDSAVEVQKEASGQGRIARVGEILIEHGVITPHQVECILRLQRKRILICALCVVQFNARDFAVHKQYFCPQCGTTLGPLGEVDSVLANDSIHGFEAPAGLPALAAPLPAPLAAALATDPFVGTTIGGYRLEKLLGRGGMGRVYLGKHQIMDKLAAVKILFGKHARDPRAVDRFFLEARAAAKLEHPGIVQILDANRDGETVYIAMQFVEGTTLEKLIRRERGLPWPEAARFLRDAAAALEFAHERQVVHRDVKPDNIMVAANGVVRLMDFGLAKDVTSAGSRLTQTGQILGTPFFMSPEQCGQGEVSGKTDVYALGVSLYYAVTGKHPFTGSTTMKVVYKHLQEQADPPESLVPQLPGPLSSLIMEMLRKDPALRPSAGAVAMRLGVLVEWASTSGAGSALATAGTAPGASTAATRATHTAPPAAIPQGKSRATPPGAMPAAPAEDSSVAPAGPPQEAPAGDSRGASLRPSSGDARPTGAGPGDAAELVCSFCEARNPAGARRCAVCGESLAPRDALEVQMHDDERGCPSCGGFMPKTERSCPHCRTRFCGACAIPLTEEARWCPTCGHGDAVPAEASSPGWWRKLFGDGLPTACPDCGGVLLSEERICPECRRRNCGGCGRNVAVDARFCLHCGRPR